jgi:serine phosphatase RsbU (regulator of sigma subunit)
MSNADDPRSINSDYIFSIYEDDAGILWLCTWGGGLNKFDKDSGEFRAYTKKDGLPSNSVYGLLEDEKGNFWLSTNNGLSRFNPKTGTFKNYNSRDGLQSNEFNGGSYYKSESGEMFFGGINGFNSFYPDEIEDNPFIPKVVITSFRKLNREVELSSPLAEIDKLFLSYRDYSFSFEFAALEYSAPDKNRYAYRMVGLEDEWIYTGAERRFAYFTTLPPGEYQFQVKASNNDGIWNMEGISVDIVITPPFWERTFFRVAVFLFVVILAWMLYKRRLRNVRLKAELDTAHNVQMSIMPDKAPELDEFDISGICLPAYEVGGDFFDYIWLDESKNRLAVVVGDVSGKAMQAAMIAVMSDGMVNTAIFESSSSAEIAGFLNEAIYRKTPDTMFTCSCLCVLDIDRREIAFTNAGMKAPLLKTENAVSVLNSMGYGLPLGAFAESQYNEEKRKFESGDVMFIFSDGLTEARNKAGEFFGDERLILMINSIDTHGLSSLKIQKRMLSVLNEFRESSQQDDDITLIVIKAL